MRDRQRLPLEQALLGSKSEATLEVDIDREKYEDLLDVYYEIRGWDPQGKLKPETLRRLGLDQEPSHML